MEIPTPLFWKCLFQSLKFSISVKVKTDKLPCNICVLPSGFCWYLFLLLSCMGTIALCRGLSPNSCPFGAHGFHSLSWQPISNPLYHNQHLGTSPEAATVLVHLTYYFGSCYSFLCPWKFPLLFCNLSSPFERCVSYLPGISKLFFFKNRNILRLSWLAYSWKKEARYFKTHINIHI